MLGYFRCAHLTRVRTKKATADYAGGADEGLLREISVSSAQSVVQSLRSSPTTARRSWKIGWTLNSYFGVIAAYWIDFDLELIENSREATESERLSPPERPGFISFSDQTRSLRAIPLGVYVFLTVFVLRLIVLVRLTNSQFLLPSSGDMFFYNDWALRILRGNWTQHTAFYGLPLYAYLLAGIYKIFGYSPFVPGLLQAVCEGGTAVLWYKLGNLIFAGSAENESETWQGKTIGLLAAVGWAFFLPAQGYSVILMPTAWLSRRLLVCRLANRQTTAGAADLVAAVPRRVNWIHRNGDRHDLVSCSSLTRGPFPPLGRPFFLSKRRGDRDHGRCLPRRVALGSTITLSRMTPSFSPRTAESISGSGTIRLPPGIRGFLPVYTLVRKPC